MTIGVGGVSQQAALAKLADMTQDIAPVTEAEFLQRIERAQQLMQQQGLGAIYVNAGTNLYYFTGTRWFSSERLVGAIIPAKGEVKYIAPAFELDTLQGYMTIKGPVHTWHEDQSPYELVERVITQLRLDNLLETRGAAINDNEPLKVGLDESTPFFITDGIAQAAAEVKFVSAKAVTAGSRMLKSATEIALIQRAMDMTLEVHKAVASILVEGITTAEVEDFIDRAHYAVGAPRGSYFCIVLFGEDTAYPHGVKSPKSLERNDTVLIDTGCQLQGYNSDITRTYVFGEASPRQRELWQLEQAAQLAAFNTANLGVSCAAVDLAARRVLETAGFGPGYAVPGLPHRTGHGIGLDIHEWPYLVLNDLTPLDVGMCFSNEPMLCVPGEFGIRHEDHFYMTDTGPKWFTEPAHSIDDPFALAC
ncbi:peptidase M24 [Shewanella denitrificans OS217]|jgi:Xaa-Pro dipeptidase|uniref:Peptidase M24 n=1 Tax=Shewanella denitrificans (strain OS217 / ATCC BAA-1090 / DSM 15013) TaxID=318161 RepID=Q12QV0_SHEDO|nr:Xaa-Pro peptidase family protein [Shewanella denitrificans]ABE54176.1 peptidase M24 [Shewanella denitrificans OS217]